MEEIKKTSPIKLKKLKGPEDLDEYIKVTSPSVWFFVCAIVALLIGLLIWSITFTLFTKVEVPVVVDGDNSFAIVSFDTSSDLTGEISIEIEGVEYYIQSISSEYVDYDSLPLEDKDGLSDTIYVYMYFNSNLPIGEYVGDIITEEINPISFLFN